MKVNAFLAVVSLSILIGCQSGTAEPRGETTSPVESSTPPTPKVPAVPGEGEPKATSESLDLSKIPAALKHDGYTYSGLEIPEQTFVQTTTGTGPEDAKVTTTYLGMKDGVPRFERKRTGAMEKMGTDIVQVTTRGVLVESMSMGTISGDSIELPASVKPGDTWTANNTVKTADTEISQKSSFKAEKMEKVKVPAGTFDTIRISMKGNLTMGATKVTVAATYWYAKGVGNVKTLLTQKVDGANSPQNYTLELKK